MNKHEVKWQGKSICEDDIELTDTIIHKGDLVTGYLIYYDKTPYIVGDLVEVDESKITLEYWIPVSQNSLVNLSQKATEKELERLQNELANISVYSLDKETITMPKSQYDKFERELMALQKNEKILVRMLEIQQHYTKNNFGVKHDREYNELRESYNWGDKK